MGRYLGKLLVLDWCVPSSSFTLPIRKFTNMVASHTCSLCHRQKEVKEILQAKGIFIMLYSQSKLISPGKDFTIGHYFGKV